MKSEQLVIGIDIGGTNLKCVLMTAKGKILNLRRMPTEAEKGRLKILSNIKEIVWDIIRENKLKKKDIKGIGLGTPGYILHGKIFGSPNTPGWNNTPIYAWMKKEFNLPFFAANDVTLAALAEHTFGSARGVQNMVCYAVGTGIGGGIVLNGELFEGTQGMAGEFGHVVVEPNGRLCGCGARGCLEAYASANGIVSMARNLLRTKRYQTSDLLKKTRGAHAALTPKLIYDRAKAGDKLCLEINNTVCKYLAIAIGGTINIFNPDMVILGGGVMSAGSIIMEGVRKFLPEYTLAQPLKKCRLAYAKLSENAGVIGSGALALRKTGLL
jgi:glucokinase